MNNVFFKTAHAELIHGDCLDILEKLPEKSVDMIFADPPYNLSNGGITCHSGRMVSVNKGEWDKSSGILIDHEFEIKWLNACRRVLKNDGTIWVSGTMHNIYSVGFALQKLEYRLLNEVCWFKPNAAPNLSCRYFTHSHEILIWAAKSSESKHKFNYQAMKAQAGGKQMRSLWSDIDEMPSDIWTITTPKKAEKKYGKHPTQKPLALVERTILAATDPGDIVLDPFTGSSTTGVAAIRNGRHFIGIDNNVDYLELSVKRLNEELEYSETNVNLIEEMV
ncbi:DNA-methyltransferase [Dehalococcoides mccartyi]|uniref:DNA-methyltransferase n=1 Tax=Dehalococcoides mccartyi TaxID=61435 RepID=UPI0009C16633|nr:site-specific DNA-methyltransferase [Dehalococcoides mccartyi]